MSCFFLVFLFVSDLFFFFKQKTAYEMRISDWSSDVCSSDLRIAEHRLDEEGCAVEFGHQIVPWHIIVRRDAFDAPRTLDGRLAADPRPTRLRPPRPAFGPSFEQQVADLLRKLMLRDEEQTTDGIIFRHPERWEERNSGEMGRGESRDEK